jgi:oligoendopeptidase F
MKRQNALNYELSLATAEVASNFLQGFVIDRLLTEADGELRLTLMMDELNGAVSSIQRQVAFYRFEQDLHRNFREAGFVSKQDIGKLFQQHMEAYMGPAVEPSPGSENWWTYVGHFRAFFYVYSYASGELIAKSLQSRVSQDPEFIKPVKEFLSTGLSKSPRQSFTDMGIDITDNAFWQQGLDKVKKLLEETEKLAQDLGKI